MGLRQKMQADDQAQPFSLKQKKKTENATQAHCVDITAVCFDWDRTLAQVIGDVSVPERLSLLFQSEGLSFTPQQVATAIDQYQADVAQKKLHFLGSPPQSQQDIMTYYAHLLRNLGMATVSQSLVERLYNGYALLPTQLYDDALPTVRALHKRGKLLGIISNHSHSVRPIIQQMVGRYIPAERVIISQEFGVTKPTPSIFHEALRCLSVPPQQTVFVGDNLEVDAIGAVVQGGLGCGFWLDRHDMGSKRPLPPNVIRITNLRQLLEWV